jgi:hypothetical protein
MQRRDAFVRDVLKEWILQHVHVEGNDVEFIGAPPNFIQRKQRVRNMVADTG